MDQVSRPLQIALVLVLGFAGLWFVALRPKPDTGGGAPASTPAPAPAQQKTSPIPGGLGNAVDKANATKAQGDAAAAAADGKASSQNTTETPAQTPPVSAVKTPDTAKAGASKGIVYSGALAIGRVSVGIDQAIVAKADIRTKPAQHATVPHRAAVKPAHRSRPGFATPGKVRAALAKRHVVVLLFYSARSSDDRQIRRELTAVDRRGGRVQVWAVSVHGLPRFKNVLQGVQILENPSVVVLSRRQPYVFPGYTDHAEINQATSVALRPGRA